MADIISKYLGELRVESAHASSGTVMLTDASKESQGQGGGFSPIDALAASLGACALTVMGFYAQTHGLDISGASVAMNVSMTASPPHRVARLELMFTMPDREYSDKDKKSLERAVNSCPVHNSLHPDIEQVFSIKWAK